MLKLSNKARGISSVDAFNRDGFYDYASRANDRSIANRVSQNGGATAYRHVITEVYGNPVRRFGVGRALFEQVIGEGNVMADKTICAQRDIFTDKRVRLNAAAAANNASLLDFNKRPNENVILNDTLVNIRRCHDSNIAP